MVLSEPIFYELLVFATGAGTVGIAVHWLTRYLDEKRRLAALSSSPTVMLEERVVRMEAVLEQTVDELRQLAKAQQFTVGLLENRPRVLNPSGMDPRPSITPHPSVEWDHPPARPAE
jgi:hypothetical protein